MNERNYGVLPLFLSFAAFIVSSFFPAVRTLEWFDVFSEYDPFIQHLWKGTIGLFFWGWMPALVLAVISLGMLRRSHHFIRGIIVCSFSTVALFLSMGWASIAFDTLFHKPL